MPNYLYQVIARYFPWRTGHDQQHRFVVGNTRQELVDAAVAANPDPKNLDLACLWASVEGPCIWVPGSGGSTKPGCWLKEADQYLG